MAAVTGALAATAVVAPAAAASATTPAPSSAPSTVSAAPAAQRVATATRATVRWVRTDRARVTKKSAHDSRAVARPDDGTRLRVLDRGKYRLQVRVPSGTVGWINKKAVTSTPLRDISGTRYTQGRVAVTKKVSGSSKVVARVHLGTKVTKLARTTQRDAARIKVKVPGGRTGWVSQSRLTKRNVWGSLASCESGGNPRTNTGNGFYGMYQFTHSTWRAVGGDGYPHRNSAREQTKRAQILQDRAGWGQWPHCTRQLGLR
ncbi:hypothetical protein GCM10009809_12710 [Isoptericola hypogeus]|uniref:Transglycosylase-like protein with SLT domain n=1 Tax=Isoptericola hypogeus TaxID=300179 RepID=A0ABP4VA47_9MICO